MLLSMIIPQFIYPSTFAGHLDNSRLGANMSSAVLNILVHSLDEYMFRILLSIYLEVE